MVPAVANCLIIGQRRLCCGAHAKEQCMTVTGMEHFTILTAELDRTVAFYREHLGLEPGARPDFGFPGAWLYCNGRAVLHVVAGRDLPVPPAGVIDHMAFAAAGLGETVRRLDAAGIAYDLRRLPGAGPWQLFFLDPNGARVELDFAQEEAAPAT
jgi:catechol 2,3-dioxygenase-like lactoylglutathione lyase family enzyme